MGICKLMTTTMGINAGTKTVSNVDLPIVTGRMRCTASKNSLHVGQGAESCYVHGASNVTCGTGREMSSCWKRTFS